MTRSLRSRRWTSSEAQRVLDDLKKSGLSTPRFARQRGLSVVRLYRWQRRLRDVKPSSQSFKEIKLFSSSSAPIEISIGHLTAKFSGNTRLDDALTFAQRLRPA